MYDDYLIHYGVIGMKWGVKRATRLTKKSVKAKKKASKAGESL